MSSETVLWKNRETKNNLAAKRRLTVVAVIPEDQFPLTYYGGILENIGMLIVSYKIISRINGSEK